MKLAELKCAACGTAFGVQSGLSGEDAVLVAEESARCARLQEIGRQRRTLAAKIQGGLAGVLGGDAVDTTDIIAQRRSLGQLDATLKAEADALARLMRHTPPASPDEAPR